MLRTGNVVVRRDFGSHNDTRVTRGRLSQFKDAKTVDKREGDPAEAPKVGISRTDVAKGGVLGDILPHLKSVHVAAPHGWPIERVDRHADSQQQEVYR